MKYRSLVRQTLHYFARPHEGLPSGPLGGPAAWRASELRAGGDFRMRLSAKEIQEIEHGLLGARAAGKELSSLSRRDFAWEKLRLRIFEWRVELQAGRGFVIVSGVPVERWEDWQCEYFFWGLGLHLGVPGAQNPQGDLLGHVRDEREPADGVTLRQYRTRAHIPFHCDAADVVGLLCLKRAKSGGDSRIASSVAVFDELLRREPAMARRLFEPYFLDTKAEGGLRAFPIAPCCYADGVLRTFYHSDYFRTASRHSEVPPLSDFDLSVLDAYDEIASSPEFCLEMSFQPGDIQLLSNHSVVHSRGGYEDFDDLDQRRHLLRLWLSLPRARSVGERVRVEGSRLGLVWDLARHRLAQRSA